jgi:hypothetical protein
MHKCLLLFLIVLQIRIRNEQYRIDPPTVEDKVRATAVFFFTYIPPTVKKLTFLALAPPPPPPSKLDSASHLMRIPSVRNFILVFSLENRSSNLMLYPTVVPAGKQGNEFISTFNIRAQSPLAPMPWSKHSKSCMVMTK